MMCKIDISKLMTLLRKDIIRHAGSDYYSFYGAVKRDILHDVIKQYSTDTYFSQREAAKIRLYHEIDKKYIGKGASSDDLSRKSACWEKFSQANSICRQQNLLFEEELDLELGYILDHAANTINDAFWTTLEKEGCPLKIHGDSMFPVGGFSTGPGSVFGVTGTSTIEKYRDKWRFSTVQGMELLQKLRRRFKPLHDLLNYHAEVQSFTKMGYVPKDQDIYRGVIPQLNGDLYLQYPAKDFLEDMCHEIIGRPITVAQDVHRELARKGSLFDNLDFSIDQHLGTRHPRHCTIDLVSASDIIGRALARFELPLPLFNYLDMCRSPTVKGPDKTMMDLEMMSNMGSAYCFPLQTCIFAAIVKAVYWRLGLRTTRYLRTFSVYGDDLIVDITAYPHVIKVLEQLKMVPNKKKSFSHGFFRESCGADYLDGVNIRPVYFETLDSDADLYSLANRLIDWSCTHGVLFKDTVPYLLSFISIKAIVPIDFGAHHGLRVPERLLSALPQEWDVVRTVVSSLPSEHNEKDLRDPYKRVLSRKRSKNLYSFRVFPIIESVAYVKNIRLAKDENSLFPFLRGGMKAVRGRVFSIVAFRGQTRILREVRTVSLWDMPTQNEGQYVPQDLDSIEYYVRILRDTLSSMWSSFADH